MLKHKSTVISKIRQDKKKLKADNEFKNIETPKVDNDPRYSVTQNINKLESLRDANQTVDEQLEAFEEASEVIEETKKNIKVIMVENDITTLRQIYEHNKTILDNFEGNNNSDVDCNMGFTPEEKPDTLHNLPKQEIVQAFEFIK